MPFFTDDDYSIESMQFTDNSKKVLPSYLSEQDNVNELFKDLQSNIKTARVMATGFVTNNYFGGALKQYTDLARKTYVIEKRPLLKGLPQKIGEVNIKSQIGMTFTDLLRLDQNQTLQLYLFHEKDSPKVEVYAIHRSQLPKDFKSLAELEEETKYSDLEVEQELERQLSFINW
jgi:hypothetical protein